MDRWLSQSIVCKGGLVLSQDTLTQGINAPGTAKVLQNYEPSIAGGYQKIKGFTKYSDTIVPGETAILGVKVALGGVVAARGTHVYFSTGGSWATVNVTARSSSATKYRFIAYTLASTPVVTFVDGYGYAAKWDGTTHTLLNGSGAPTNPKYATEFLKRLVLAGYTSNPRAFIVSAPLDDTVFSGGGAIEVVVGDTIVGLKSFRDTLYIFCQNSIWKLTGTSSSDFAVARITKSIGCLGSDTIQEVGGDLLFLAPDGLRSLSATARIGDVSLALQSSQIQPIIAAYTGTFTNDCFTSCVIRPKSQYRLFVFNQASLYLSATYGSATTAIYGSSVYGLVADDSLSTGVIGKLGYDAYGNSSYEWATTLGLNVFSVDSDYSNNVELVVFGHPANGYIYKMENGSDFDGVAVSYRYRSPDVILSNGTASDVLTRKVMQKATIYTEVQGEIAANLQVYFDAENSPTNKPPSIPLAQTGDINIYSTAVYGTATYSALPNPIFKKNLIGAGFTVAFEFSGTDNTPPHRIDSYQIEYSVKGKR